MKTKKITINGIVQGVGFRPFIYNLANNMNIKGYVINSSKGVVIEVNCDDDLLVKFIDNIKTKKPPQSEIYSINIEDVRSKRYDSFTIKMSRKENKTTATIPADLAICDDCIKDIFSPDNRRYLYPFTNCTNCGPRFSIVEKIPYDRKKTTMRKFKMCKMCLKEYENPTDRRFHAQPNACFICGPHVWIYKNGKKICGIKAIDLIVDEIIKGNIVLIKGLGGFHIACDCFNENSVLLIRKIKNREFKPLAVMIDEIDDIIDKVYINEFEKKLLNSSVSPIVMLRKRDESFDYVSNGLDSVGVMLAYTPVHKIIFKRLKDKNFKNPLVMTSGNFKDEPIIKDNGEIKKRFSKFSILYHNREIHNRIDDSLCFVDSFNNTRLIRRARGYVPNSIKIGFDNDIHLFATGGDIKNVMGFYRKGEVILSQYIGDLEIESNRDFYIDSYRNFKKLYDFKPEVLIRDMHPGYYSRIISDSFRISKKVDVQHHISHISSVMAEYSLMDNVIGVAFDGTGYGVDANIWGGEFFIVKGKKIKRVGHIKYFKLPGSDLCVKEVWRIFASVFSNNRDFVYKFLKEKIELDKINFIFNMMDKNINSPFTSSFGRLFDAISVVVTGNLYSNFEAEMPMRIEKLAYEKTNECYRFEIKKENDIYIIDFDNIINELIMDYLNGRKKLISAKFHKGVVNLIKEFCIKLSNEYDIKDICVSGGVFQNRFIVNEVQRLFVNSDINIYLNSKVPSNDGCISLGQIFYYLGGFQSL